MPEKHYLTPEGLERLTTELAYLKGPAREQLAQRLRSAIQQGDLSENADYIAAKEEQGFLEGRIQELEQIINNVEIIQEKAINRIVVEIGATVTIQEGDFEPDVFQVVGPKEADPGKGRISFESPIGKAIVGHKVGDIVFADAPDGTIQLKIIKIE